MLDLSTSILSMTRLIKTDVFSFAGLADGNTQCLEQCPVHAWPRGVQNSWVLSHSILHGLALALALNMKLSICLVWIHSNFSVSPAVCTVLSVMSTVRSRGICFPTHHPLCLFFHWAEGGKLNSSMSHRSFHRNFYL